MCACRVRWVADSRKLLAAASISPSCSGQSPEIYGDFGRIECYGECIGLLGRGGWQHDDDETVVIYSVWQSRPCQTRPCHLPFTFLRRSPGCAAVRLSRTSIMCGRFALGLPVSSPSCHISRWLNECVVRKSCACSSSSTPRA